MRLSNIFLIFCIALLYSCKLNTSQDIKPNWNTYILGPLVKSSLTLKNFSDLQNIHATQTIRLSDIESADPGDGFPGNASGTTIIPPVSNVPLGPYTLDLTSAFTQAVFDSGEFYFVITNGFPVDVKKGTTLTFTQNGNLFAFYTLTSDIAPNGGTYTFSPPINLTGRTLYSQMSMSVDFSSDGSGTTPVTFNSNDYLTIEILLDKVKVNSITVKPGNTFTVSDTTNFQVSGDVIKANTISGNFITHFGNGLPLEFDAQAYFLDENKTLIDSLFRSSALIHSANITNCQTSTIYPTLDTVPYTASKQNTLNNSRYVWLNFTIKSLGTCSAITITETDTMEVQIVGDLTLNITN